MFDDFFSSGDGALGSMGGINLFSPQTINVYPDGVDGNGESVAYDGNGEIIDNYSKDPCGKGNSSSFSFGSGDGQGITINNNISNAISGASVDGEEDLDPDTLEAVNNLQTSLTGEDGGISA